MASSSGKLDELEFYTRQQQELKYKIIEHDTEIWQRLKKLASVDDSQCNDSDCLSYVAGLDLSYLKSEPNTACVALVVCSLPNLNVVYKSCNLVECTSKYIPGFLAARESPFLIDAFKNLLKTSPCYAPQAVLIDGNGVLHPNGCGIACVFGVLTDVPTIGVAKNIFRLDGLEKNVEHKLMIKQLAKKGDTFPLIGSSGRTWGLALRSGNVSSNPVFVSVGHKISLTTAAWVVNECSQYRIPEPIRQADVLSREFLKITFPDKQ